MTLPKLTRFEQRPALPATAPGKCSGLLSPAAAAAGAAALSASTRSANTLPSGNTSASNHHNPLEGEKRLLLLTQSPLFRKKAAEDCARYLNLAAALRELELDTSVRVSRVLNAGLQEILPDECAEYLERQQGLFASTSSELSDSLASLEKKLRESVIPPRKKRDHPTNVKQILETWYKEHEDSDGRAYVTKEEKETLARLCNIEQYQVSTWVSNRRNRKAK
jgi:hypothetical protein